MIPVDRLLPQCLKVVRISRNPGLNVQGSLTAGGAGVQK